MAYLTAFLLRRLRYLNKKLPAQGAGGRYKGNAQRSHGFVEVSPSRVFRDGEGIFDAICPRHPKFKRGAPAWRAPCTAPTHRSIHQQELILRRRRRGLLPCAARNAIATQSSSPHEF